MVEGQRPRTHQAGLLERPRQDTTHVLQGQPHAGVQQTAWSMTALGLRGGRDRNPEVWVLMRLESGAQDAALADATQLGSISPRGGSLDRGPRCHAPPPLVSVYVAGR